MKKNTPIAIVLFFCIAATGCGTDRETYRSFIKGFYPKAQGMYLTQYDMPVGYMEFGLSGDHYGIYSAGAGYDSLCTLYADMTYNRKFNDPAGGVHDVLMHSTQIEGVSVVSDRDFDSGHPAGTPLDDIVYLVSASPRAYISSGYRNTYDWKRGSGLSEHYSVLGYASKLRFNRRDTSNDGFHPVQGYLNQLSASDLLLLGSGKSQSSGYLAFDREPAEKGTHNITVTINCSEGVFSKSIPVLFPW